MIDKTIRQNLFSANLIPRSLGVNPENTVARVAKTGAVIGLCIQASRIIAKDACTCLCILGSEAEFLVHLQREVSMWQATYTVFGMWHLDRQSSCRSSYSDGRRSHRNGPTRSHSET